jgi:hypothetical protein
LHPAKRVVLTGLLTSISLVAALVVALIAVPHASATAAGQRCLTHLPTSVADYGSVTDSRDASFGIGDVTSSVLLPDGRRFFALGDTAYYDVAADGSRGQIKAFGNNSAWVQSGNCFTLLNGTNPGTKSWVVPPQKDGSFYWPGASVVVGSHLEVFMQRLTLGDGFGTSLGAVVAEFNLPSLTLTRISPIPWMPHRVYGSGAVYDGGYVYAYASQPRTCTYCFSSDLYVARVPASQLTVASAWRFSSGTNWVADRNAAWPVLVNAVSSTDVQPYGTGFLLITKPLSVFGAGVEAWWSPSPEGPWRDLGNIFTIADPPTSPVPGNTYQSAYTYNPIVYANPTLGDGTLLASFNVNTFDSGEARTDGRLWGPRFLSVTLPPPPTESLPPPPSVQPPPPPSVPTASNATFVVDRFGRVRTGSGTVFEGGYTTHAVGVAATMNARGGWVAAADGGVFAFGDARFYGSMGAVRLNQPIVGIAATPTGHGYWMVARDGGIFSFGDARFAGSTGAIRLNQPIVAMAASSSGGGYWFVASDGGIFSFGDAQFFGSTGGSPPRFAVTGMAAKPGGRGYWLVTVAGQVFSFGGAKDEGGAPLPLAAFCVGIVAAPGGYRIVDTSGNVFIRSATPAWKRIATSEPLVSAG